MGKVKKAVGSEGQNGNLFIEDDDIPRVIITSFSSEACSTRTHTIIHKVTAVRHSVDLKH